MFINFTSPVLTALCDGSMCHVYNKIGSWCETASIRHNVIHYRELLYKCKYQQYANVESYNHVINKSAPSNYVLCSVNLDNGIDLAHEQKTSYKPNGACTVVGEREREAAHTVYVYICTAIIHIYSTRQSLNLSGSRKGRP